MWVNKCCDWFIPGVVQKCFAALCMLRFIYIYIFDIWTGAFIHFQPIEYESNLNAPGKYINIYFSTIAKLFCS